VRRKWQVGVLQCLPSEQTIESVRLAMERASLRGQMENAEDLGELIDVLVDQGAESDSDLSEEGN
jgi:hypothetical protein